ncbi:zinc finger BED domain-containing protein RICESLEEPER 2-like protein [Tanacetum coccineum]
MGVCKARRHPYIRQRILAGNSQSDLINYVYNEKDGRNALAKMVILHECPLLIVDHTGFKSFTRTIQPLFKFPSRNTLNSDIIKLYGEQKNKVIKDIENNQSRVAIKTYMWTSSHQKKGFMAITGHFINNEWYCEVKSQGNSKSDLINYVYNEKDGRNALAKKAILHKYHVSIVDLTGFKSFTRTIQPLFKFPSRNTLNSDIIKLYGEQKIRGAVLFEKNGENVTYKMPHKMDRWKDGDYLEFDNIPSFWVASKGDEEKGEAYVILDEKVRELLRFPLGRFLDEDLADLSRFFFVLSKPGEY